METRSWFRMRSAPEGAQLEALLDFAAARRAHYPTFLLVERASLAGESASDAPREASGPRALDDRARLARELLSALEPHLLTEARTDRWPGKLGPAGSARVRFYRLDRPATRLLARVGSLAGFLAPLPEDLCVLAADKSPWLVSSARTNQFHLQLTATEQRALAKSLPWLQLEPEPEPPHE